MVEQFEDALYLTHCRNGKFVETRQMYDPTRFSAHAERVRQFAYRAAKGNMANAELTKFGWVVRSPSYPT